MKHRNDAFIRAFLNGEAVQFRPIGTQHQNSPWLSVGALRLFDEPNFEFRVTPPKKWVRVALMRHAASVRFVGSDFSLTTHAAESHPAFIRWLTDRIEYTEGE